VLNYSESIWSYKRYGIMLNGLRLKFSQKYIWSIPLW